jgi:hypothetical protein
MVTIFYKWLLGDETNIEDELEIEDGDVCYISNLPLLRQLTDELPPEPTPEEEPHTVQGGF